MLLLSLVGVSRKHSCLSTNKLLNFSPSLFFSSYSYWRCFFFLFRAFEDFFHAEAEEFPWHSNSASSFQFECLPLRLQHFCLHENDIWGFLFRFFTSLFQEWYLCICAWYAALCTFFFYLLFYPRWINGNKYIWAFCFLYGWLQSEQLVNLSIMAKQAWLLIYNRNLGEDSITSKHLT